MAEVLRREQQNPSFRVIRMITSARMQRSPMRTRSWPKKATKGPSHYQPPDWEMPSLMNAIPSHVTGHGSWAITHHHPKSSHGDRIGKVPS